MGLSCDLPIITLFLHVTNGLLLSLINQTKVVAC